MCVCVYIYIYIFLHKNISRFIVFLISDPLPLLCAVIIVSPSHLKDKKDSEKGTVNSLRAHIRLEVQEK